MSIIFKENYKCFDITKSLFNQNKVFGPDIIRDRFDCLSIIDRSRVLNWVDMSFLINMNWIKKIILNIHDFDINYLLSLQESLESVSMHLDIDKNGDVFTEFPNLISLEANTKNNIFLNNMPQLRNLNIASVDLSKLNFENLRNLARLQIGGSKNWRACNIHHLTRLKGLTIGFDNNIQDISFISKMENIECISFLYTSKIKIFPDISNLKKLKRIHIYALNRLEDISQIRHSESIEELIIVNSSIKDDILRPIVDCPNLKRVAIPLKNISDNKKAHILFADKIDQSILDTPFYIS